MKSVQEYLKEYLKSDILHLVVNDVSELEDILEGEFIQQLEEKGLVEKYPGPINLYGNSEFNKELAKVLKEELIEIIDTNLDLNKIGDTIDTYERLGEIIKENYKIRKELVKSTEEYLQEELGVSSDIISDFIDEQIMEEIAERALEALISIVDIDNIQQGILEIIEMDIGYSEDIKNIKDVIEYDDFNEKEELIDEYEVSLMDVGDFCRFAELFNRNNDLRAVILNVLEDISERVD